MTDDSEKKDDYIEIEFELGDLEFEAKGTGAVVERLFNLLIAKIESGAIEIAAYEGEDEEDEEDYEEDEDEEDYEEEEEDYDEDEEVDYSEEEESDTEDLDPPPEWKTFEEEPPEITDIEKEAFDIE